MKVKFIGGIILMLSIVFIATQWGTNEGGINSFNYDLVKAIANTYKNQFHILCVVKEADYKEVYDANNLGIDILVIEGRFNSGVIFDEVKRNGHDKVICWVGHDTITGFKAIECANLDKYLENPSKSIVIHHMSYINYYTSKSGDGEKAIQKNKLQKKALEQADLVFAVGPYLVESAKNKLKTSKNQNPIVYEIIPGLADLENIILNGEFRGIVYGRLGDDDEIVKQGKLAIASFFKACTEDQFNNTILTVVGLNREELTEKQNELQKMGYEHSNKLCNVVALPYKNREELHDIVRDQDISLMLSTHEGFGLVGWEAISAGIPLILSIDTGLYKFLDKLGGSYTGCIYGIKITGDFNNDLETVTPIIKDIKNDISKARKKAKDLKELLKCYSWENAAKDFFTNIPIESILKEYQDASLKKGAKLARNENSKESITITTPFLFSTATHLSYIISKNFFKDIHHTWCAPKFDAKETNPSSSNPLELYKKLIFEVQNEIEGAAIYKQKIGILRAVSAKRQQEIITEEEEQKIIDIIGAARIEDYRPVIYVIPTNKVENLIEAASHTKKDGILSQEFLIRELPGDLLELLDIDI